VRAAAQARVVGSAASVHTVTTVETEPEEHKFDYTPEVRAPNAGPSIQTTAKFKDLPRGSHREESAPC